MNGEWLFAAIVAAAGVVGLTTALALLQVLGPPRFRFPPPPPPPEWRE